MTRDYGGPARDRARSARMTALLLAPILGLLIIGGGLGYAWWTHQIQAVAQSNDLTRAFSISGPPCPALGAAEFAARGIVPAKSFEFGKVRFARRFGHADCAMVAFRDAEGTGGYPVCQFTAPALLAVRTAEGEAFFAPGVGVPATVAVRAGRPSCVLATRLGGEFGAVSDEGSEPAR